MSKETTGGEAIRSMHDLSNSIIMGLTSDMHRIITRIDTLENYIREANELSKNMTREVLKLHHEIHEMRKLLNDPTVDALTGPLLELQDKNQRRREKSAVRRIYGDSG